MAGEGVELAFAADAGEVYEATIDTPYAVKGIILEGRVEGYHCLCELSPG